MATFVALNNMNCVPPCARSPFAGLGAQRGAALLEEAARISCLDCEIVHYRPSAVWGWADVGLSRRILPNVGGFQRFGFDFLQTERDLFEIDHCAAGAYLAWLEFPGSTRRRHRPTTMSPAGVGRSTTSSKSVGA